MVEQLRRVLADDTGSELVEFAMSIWIWVGIVFLLLYGTFGIYVEHFVGEAAHEAVRYAMVRGSTWDGTSCTSTSTMECTATSTDVTNFVAARRAPGIAASNLSVSTTWPGVTSSGAACDTEDGADSPDCIVKVEVDYNLTFPFAKTLKLSDTAEMAISE
jgi:hypothetical protein